MKIPHPQKNQGPPYPPYYAIFGRTKGVIFKSCPMGSKTSGMTSLGLGEMVEDDSADTCAGKFPLMSMGGRANRQACADGDRLNELYASD